MIVAWSLKRDEILVAVEEAQAVDRLFIAIAVVVAHFELLARLVLLSQAHQIDAELRASGPELRIGGDGLTVVVDCILISAIQHQVVSHNCIGFAVRRIDLLNFCEPRIWRAVGQHLHGRVDCHRIESVGRKADCLIGLADGLIGIGVFESKIRHQLVGFHEFRIEGDGARGPINGFVIKSVGADQRESQIGSRVFGIALQGFFE